MSRSTPALIAGVASALLAACSESPTAANTVWADALAPLSLNAPVLTAEDLYLTKLVEVGARAGSGPARMDEAGELESEEQPAAEIFSPRTKAGFWEGQAWADGIHQYNGNVGRIEVTAKVYAGTSQIGTQTAVRQKSVWFPFQLGQIDFVTQFSPVSIDVDCGLRVSGSSLHKSWFEFYTGVGAPTWGETALTTVASASSQPECEEEETLTQSGVTLGEPTNTTCTVLITYDLETGEILGVAILSCQVEDE